MLVVGPAPMALVFNGFELGAILLAILIANYVTHEGESTWFEGVQLLALYVILALAFLVSVVVDNPPYGSHYGGTVAAPAFGEIAKFTLPYLGVAADNSATTP